jgi:xanthine dehydrogenase YagS FAD-binding subunit
MTPVRLVHARSAIDAARLLREHAPHAQLIAAGGDLLGLWKEGVLERAHDAPVWVDLSRAGELAQVERHADGGWRLGAMATLRQLQRTPGIAPMLAEAVAHIASPQLRSRTTLGGNLLQRPRCWIFRHPDMRCFKKGSDGCPAIGGPPQAHPGAIGGAGPCHAAHPSDLATVLLALDARVETVTTTGATRSMALGELYRGAASNRARETCLASDEVLVAVHVPESPATQAFENVAPRAANEFAAASAAVLLRFDGARIAQARVARGGVAAEPGLCATADALLQGRLRSDVDLARVARQLAAFRDATAATQARVSWCRWVIERALARALAARSA